MVKTDDALLEVHLGPRAVLDRLGLKLERGVSLTVKGSSVLVAGKPEIIAQTVQVGSATFVLRDALGVPVWSPDKQ